jgi:hypothetical protein
MNIIRSFKKWATPLIGGKHTTVLVAALVLSWPLAKCQGQGTMQFNFDGQPPGTWVSAGSYSESGMTFWNPYGPQGFARVGSGVSWGPDNGSAYLQTTTGANLVFGFYTSPTTYFNLVSFDVAEYDTSLSGPVTLHVVGYRAQHAPVVMDFTTDGINDGPGGLPDFQTLYFNSEFVQLNRVEILTDRWSIDNVVISGVPEPSTGALLLLGAACALGRLRDPWTSSRPFWYRLITGGGVLGSRPRALTASVVTRNPSPTRFIS